ncbi:VCBS domain-containing protein, partial [Vibrio sp. TRT 17S01]|uniref:VCBS domain-containing protein n=1 Tax=Vibrio sp. TRT 17S01 TaxID=3418505 RepID=UPI003CF598EF
MNTATLAPFVLANTTIVIDTNGQIRPLLPGEIPGPGEVIVTVGRGATAATESSTEGASFPDISAEFVQDGGTGLPLDLDSEIASIIEQIEEGVDPTQNEDFATAAGGQNGSSLTGSGDIDRTGAETQAETFFDTSGLESQGLSETQSLALIDVVEESLVSSQAVIIGDDNVAVFETDEPVVVEGTLIATDTDDPTFIPQTDTPGTNGLFSIDEFGNWTFVANSAFDELNVGDSLSEDFEVTASDGTVSTVTVTINGTNDLPEFSPNDGDQYSFSYEEGTAEGVTVGQVSATDPDNEVLAFSISSNITDGEGNDLYQIDPVTGEISLTAEGAAAFSNDFEVLNNAHNLVVTVIEVDGLGTPQSVDVDVVLNELNIDDNAPIFNDTNGDGDYVFNYDENSTDAYVIGTVSATDADGEDVTYSIKTNVFDADDNPLFEIDELTGEISLTEDGVAAFSNDYETLANTHNLVVTATEVDGLGEVKTTDVDVILNEQNLDDNGPIFNDTNGDGDYVFSYDENSSDAYVIGTVSATDADGEDVTYSIKTNVYDASNNPLFEIDELTGEISLTEDGVAAFSNDYETLANTHNLVVTATEVDGLGEVKTTDVDVILNEQNLDDNGPIFNDTNGDGDYVFNYDENSTDAYVIGTVSATDADGEDVTYSIKTNVYDADNNPLFEIDELTGEISLTEDGVAAFSNDYETLANTHNLVVTATEVDGLGEVKTTDVDVILNEQNLDDNGPIFNDTNGDGDYVFNYDENSSDAYVIGTVSATDADGENVTYSIKTNVYDASNNPL